MRKFLNIIFIGLIVFLPFLQPTATHAHALSASFGKIVLEESQITYIFSIDDLSVIENIQLDQNNDSTLSQEEVDNGKASIEEWIGQNLTMQADGVALRPSTGKMISEQRNDKNVVTTTLTYSLGEESKTITLVDNFYKNTNDNTTYTQLLTIEQDGNFSEKIIKGDDRTWEADLTVEGAATSGTSWWEFFLFGMEHILTGYDHLLFLFALLLARQSFKDHIKVVTAFTIAHSITITLGYLEIIKLPGLLVESVIALSIVYVAIENIFRKEVKKRYILTFMFGLVHGLGFAGLLSEMTIPKSHLAISLLSFNLGIEVIQVALVALVLPFLAKVQKLKQYPSTLKYGSAIIIFIGGYWVIERVFQL
ncbi:HupE/UreJ family protein [Sutcliffiella halmapala]